MVGQRSVRSSLNIPVRGSIARSRADSQLSAGNGSRYIYITYIYVLIINSGLPKGERRRMIIPRLLVVAIALPLVLRPLAAAKTEEAKPEAKANTYELLNLFGDVFAGPFRRTFTQ